MNILESLMLILVGSFWLLILLFIICACVLAKRSDKEKEENK